VKDQRLGGARSAKFVRDCGGVARVLKPLTPRRDNLADWERDELLARMRAHGFDKVRGWEITSNELSAGQAEAVKMLICAQDDACRKCGRSGHFASSCFARSEAPWLANLGAAVRTPAAAPRRIRRCHRCARTGHRTEECYARTHQEGHELECLRCGRLSHSAVQCYARTTCDGEDLYSESD
jgi:hypothetical protein